MKRNKIKLEEIFFGRFLMFDKQFGLFKKLNLRKFINKLLKIKIII